MASQGRLGLQRPCILEAANRIRLARRLAVFRFDLLEGQDVQACAGELSTHRIGQPGGLHARAVTTITRCTPRPAARATA
jgi:hypothetical protein